MEADISDEECLTSACIDFFKIWNSTEVCTTEHFKRGNFRSNEIHSPEFRYPFLSFLITKPTRCTNFSNLCLKWNSTCFKQFLCPLLGVFHCIWYMSYRFADRLRAGSGCSVLILLASCQQTCTTYTIAVCTVKNFWRWTEELSETCRVSFQE
jgi:hypothetical protein